MKSVMDEPVTNGSAAATKNRTQQQDENDAEIAGETEEVLNEAKAAIFEKLEDTKDAAKRLLKHGSYALEDIVSELAHNIKKHPIGFLGFAFAAGTVLGLLLPHSSQQRDTD
jgi:ElaB/YqjD/DUF883 family membrane-anchored ribosome-binding protein